jgi:uncharacterized membrane protein (UPF0136 family)
LPLFRIHIFDLILNDVANKTIVTGILLVILGLGGYFGTGTSSFTALIPAAFGVVFLAFGFMARDDSKRKMAMHITAALALIGFIACVPGLLKFPTMLAGESTARPAAVISQVIMAFITGIYLLFAIQSFRAARKARIT